MFTLFTLPSAGDIIGVVDTVTTTNSTGIVGTSYFFFAEFLPIVYLAVGVLIFALGVKWLQGNLKGGMRTAFGQKKWQHPRARMTTVADYKYKQWLANERKRGYPHLSE